jgi:hypothetical protein
MTPGESAKAAGLKLAVMAKLINRPRQWLDRIYHDNPELWEIIVLGCKAKQDK